MLRTIMAVRATACMVLYQPWFSSGSFGSTVSFTLVAVSTFEMSFIWLAFTFLYFSFITFPSSVLAVTMSRLLFLPWFTLMMVSGMSTTSFSKARRFLGSAFFCCSAFLFCLLRHCFSASSGSFPAASASFLTFCNSCFCRCASCFCLALSCFLRCSCDLDGSRSKRWLAFLRKGTWL